MFRPRAGLVVPVPGQKQNRWRVHSETEAKLRSEILELIRRFGELRTTPRPFRPGVDPVPVSWKVLDPADFAALVDASLDGWLTFPLVPRGLWLAARRVAETGRRLATEVSLPR